jgi:hypothetical protein
LAKLERRREEEHPSVCPGCAGLGKPRWEIIGGVRGNNIQRFGGCFQCRAVSVLHRIDWRNDDERAEKPDPWS